MKAQEIIEVQQVTARLASELFRRAAEMLLNEADRLDRGIPPAASAEKFADAAILLELVEDWHDDLRQHGAMGDTPLAAALSILACAECVSRAEDVDRYVQAVRTALLHRAGLPQGPPMFTSIAPPCTLRA